MRVLLVDDSTTMRKILRSQLSALGISDILEASNGVEAIEMLEANMPVDIVSLDINMPDMDGMTCLRTIKKNGKFAGVKLIMVTSESEKQKVIEAVQMGADNYLVKPFTFRDLKAKFGM